MVVYLGRYFKLVQSSMCLYVEKSKYIHALFSFIEEGEENERKYRANSERLKQVYDWPK